MGRLGFGETLQMDADLPREILLKSIDSLFTRFDKVPEGQPSLAKEARRLLETLALYLNPITGPLMVVTDIEHAVGTAIRGDLAGAAEETVMLAAPGVLHGLGGFVKGALRSEEGVSSSLARNLKSVAEGVHDAVPKGAESMATRSLEHAGAAESNEARAIEELLGDGAGLKQRRALFITGGPGAGKTTLGPLLAKGLDAVYIDADRALEILKRTEGGNYRSLRALANSIRDKALLKAIESGDNIVLEGTGSVLEQVLKHLETLRNANYHIDYKFLDVDAVEAAKRVIKRAELSGTPVISLSSILRKSTGARETYDAVKRLGLADAGERLDTNVPEGTMPISVESWGHPIY
jgi:shikimate kinase